MAWRVRERGGWLDLILPDLVRYFASALTACGKGPLWCVFVGS